MFLIPFLKYFKPFLWRLGVAIFGMVAVALLSAVPIFVAGQAVKILIHQGNVLQADQGEKSGKGAKSPADSETMEGAAANMLGSAAGKTVASKDEPTSSTSKQIHHVVDQQLAKYLRGVYTVPRDRIQPIIEATENRIHAWRDWYESSVNGDTVLVKAGASTAYHYELGAASTSTTLTIFNADDDPVQTVELGPRPAGAHDYTWPARIAPKGSPRGAPAGTAPPAIARDGTYRIGIAAQDAKGQKVLATASMHGPMMALCILVVLLIVITAVKGLFEFVAKYQLAHTLFLSNLQIREDIFSNVLTQDYLYFNQNSTGWLHSRINSDVKAVGDILESMMQDGFQQPITLAVMFTILLILNAQLTLLVICVVPIVAALMLYFARILRKNQRKQKRQSDQLSSCLTESLNNIRLVKALGTERLETRKFHEASMSLFKSLMARRLAKFGSSPVMESLGSVAIGGVLMLAGWMVFRPVNGMDISTLLMYFYTLTRFYRPLKSLANMTQKYQIGRVSAERMEQMLALRPTVIEIENPVPFTGVERGIVFDNVGFRYGEKEVLSNIRLDVRAGRRVAFVGASGAGKTTLVNLIARLFDPSSGEILIDEVDLRHLSQQDWREHLAIVTQDTYLFDDSIAANIAYGRVTKIDMGRVEAAARAANAHDFIMGLDGGKGYQTKIGPTGARLSGGQKQRLSIARALYRDPKILILDEATSALDAQSQELVQQALDVLMRNRTTFIIAHRISTVRNADCIYVLSDGRIIEAGTHEQLLAQGGHYAEMLARVGLRGTPTLEPLS